MNLADGTPLAKVAEHLRDDEVHVWRLPFTPAQGRAPLLALLGAYLGRDAGSVRLVSGEYGRPALAEASALDFNWSHSGSLALAALARGTAPGIDVERVRPRPRAWALAQRYFTPAEVAALSRLAPDEREAAFLRLWTAKEAVLKAMGRGLAFGLHRLDIECDVGMPRLRALEGDDAARWQLHALPAGEDCVATLAWRGEARQVRLWSLAAG
ncbi:MAG TPA: 4'-phosphopantetheinyl transferase superfamily protein [Frateuria sp.]|uniref:4'-phosphopantetheinyl transferase family protein n=1 Tax=Frateuria sp. TaxID=2211372 RepID=UPI002DF263C2|nr:4'-phosphopantetheinyl transferase superfamily protein [Frateuria sp.]